MQWRCGNVLTILLQCNTIRNCTIILILTLLQLLYRLESCWLCWSSITSLAASSCLSTTGRPTRGRRLSTPGSSSAVFPPPPSVSRPEESVGWWVVCSWDVSRSFSHQFSASAANGGERGATVLESTTSPGTLVTRTLRKRILRELTTTSRWTRSFSKVADRPHDDNVLQDAVSGYGD